MAEKKDQTKEQIKKQEKIEKRRWNPYRGKLQAFALKISLFAIIFIIFIGFTVGLSTYRDTLSAFDNKNIKDLKRYIQVINRQSGETKNNLSLAKKYNERWKNASDKKRNNKGISLEIIESEISNLAKKYNISGYDFTMSVPKKTHSKKNKILNIFFSDCKISFNSADDVRAIAFIEDLKNNLTGYVVINGFSIDKSKQYEFSDLVNISSGKESGILKIVISFKWFVAKKIK